MTSTAIVNDVRNFCHALRDDGVGYSDHLEQLTYLLFLKMADEYRGPLYERDTKVPTGFDRRSCRSASRRRERMAPYNLSPFTPSPSARYTVLVKAST
nr:hypothetical protein [Flavobacteriales bacterium]HMR28380.1 hypothetical protein [Flavobacteriales bacterium]